MDIQDIINTLKKGKDAEDLLHRILSYYDIYSGQFSEIPQHDVEYGKFSLNTEIRHWLNFDDSE